MKLATIFTFFTAMGAAAAAPRGQGHEESTGRRLMSKGDPSGVYAGFSVEEPYGRRQLLDSGSYSYEVELSPAEELSFFHLICFDKIEDLIEDFADIISEGENPFADIQGLEYICWFTSGIVTITPGDIRRLDEESRKLGCYPTTSMNLLGVIKSTDYDYYDKPLEYLLKPLVKYSGCSGSYAEGAKTAAAEGGAGRKLSGYYYYDYFDLSYDVTAAIVKDLNLLVVYLGGSATALLKL